MSIDVERHQRRATVIGPGAMGILVGSTLARAGWHVATCVGRPLERLQTHDERHGYHVVAVEHVDQPSALRPSDLVVLTVKAHHTAAVAPWLSAATTRFGTRLLVVQNGVEHLERVRPHAPTAEIVPAVVYAPVERHEPGTATIRHPHGPDLAVPGTSAGRAVARELERGGLRVATEADFTTTVWSKLLVNLCSSSVTTLTGRSTDVVQDPQIAAYLRALLAEAAQVARAAGAAISDIRAAQVVDWLQALPPGSSTSMLADRLAGRPLEHDAITGALLRSATRKGVEAPLVTHLHALLAATSDGLDRHRTSQTTPPRPGTSDSRNARTAAAGRTS